MVFLKDSQGEVGSVLVCSPGPRRWTLRPRDGGGDCCGDPPRARDSLGNPADSQGTRVMTTKNAPQLVRVPGCQGPACLGSGPKSDPNYPAAGLRVHTSPQALEPLLPLPCLSTSFLEAVPQCRASQGRPLSSSLIFLPPLYCKASVTTLKMHNKMENKSTGHPLRPASYCPALVSKKEEGSQPTGAQHPGLYGAPPAPFPQSAPGGCTLHLSLQKRKQPGR